MLEVDNELLNNFFNTYKDMYMKQKCSPLMFSNWFKKAFKIIKKEYKERTYPYTIKIADTAENYNKIIRQHGDEISRIKEEYKGVEAKEKLDELLFKILKPVEEITIKEPIKIDGQEIWFGNTMDGIPLRLGYKNSDSRYVDSLVIGGNMVHGKLGGATGAGKSVLLNQIIVAMLLELPPWELQLTLCDFKFVEMVRYVNVVPTPQVSQVVACNDIDYVLSLFKASKADMIARQDLFTSCNVDNLKSWRKKFGMAMPQRLNIIDEVQQLFTQNPKMNPKIESELQALTKLGRALGDHLLFSSQSMKGTLSKDNLANFKLGIALYCEPDVSEMLIGNDRASQIKRKGLAIANPISGTGKVEDNVQYRIPLISEDGITDYLIELNRCYEEVYNRKPFTGYYDEHSQRKEKAFIDDFKKYKMDGIFELGDAVRYRKGVGANLEFFALDNGQDSDNVLCISQSSQELFYLFNLMILNNKYIFPNSTNILISGSNRNDIVTKAGDFVITLTSKKVSDLEQTYSIMNMRKRIYELDSQLDCCCIDYLKEQLNNANDEYVKQDIEKLITTRRKYPVNRRLKLSDFPLTNIYIYDAQNIIGLGRSSKSKTIDELKNVFYDSTVYNVRYYLLTDSLQEFNDLLSGINHRLIGSVVDEKDKNKLKFYDKLDKTLCAYKYRKIADDVIKFKKVLLDIPKIEIVREVELRNE